jgi:hypothetical protein
MRFLFPFLLLPLLTACQKSTAGLTIPPRQVFVLGEYMDAGYRADIRNDGPQPVTVRLINRDSRETDRELILVSGKQETVYVGANQEVRLYNNDDRKAKLLIEMNKGVEGMRYEGMDGQPADRLTADPPASEDAPVTPRQDAGPAQRQVNREIPPGQQLIIGEGSSQQYTVRMRVTGGMIEVSGRDKRSGRQLQGFGLKGREEVTIRPTEDLYLINTGQEAVRIRLTFDRPVSGVRMAEG